MSNLVASASARFLRLAGFAALLLGSTTLTTLPAQAAPRHAPATVTADANNAGEGGAFFTADANNAGEGGAFFTADANNAGEAGAFFTADANNAGEGGAFFIA